MATLTLKSETSHARFDLGEDMTDQYNSSKPNLIRDGVYGNLCKKRNGTLKQPNRRFFWFRHGTLSPHQEAMEANRLKNSSTTGDFHFPDPLCPLQTKPCQRTRTRTSNGNCCTNVLAGLCETMAAAPALPIKTLVLRIIEFCTQEHMARRLGREAVSSSYNSSHT
jgi:hypothetical protein